MKRKSAPVKAGKTRLLIVDDHPMIREHLAELINREPDLIACGEAEDVPQTLRAIEQLHPHLAIIDLSLKNADGLDLIRTIRASYPKLPMLVVSMHDESLYAPRVLHAGARGYINKQEASQKIMQAIRRVLSGEVYLSERMAAQWVNTVADKPEVPLIARLSDRELEIYRRIGSGQGTREIAESLHIGISTIETYRCRIKRKLHLPSPMALAQQAALWVEESGRGPGLAPQAGSVAGARSRPAGRRGKISRPPSRA